jgi:hypothetical protein
MIATVAPRPASSVARTTADVDFPAPPFGLAKTIVGMERPLVVEAPIMDADS